MEHVVKRYCVQGTAVEGNIEEERGRGRKRMGILGDRKGRSKVQKAEGQGGC